MNSEEEDSTESSSDEQIQQEDMEETKVVRRSAPSVSFHLLSLHEKLALFFVIV